MNYNTSGTIPDPERVIASLSVERARYKNALERIVAIADPPGGPPSKECVPILTIAVLALEDLERGCEVKE